MSAAALQAQDALRPRGDSRLGLGAALALLAHGGLVGALALGLNWRLPQATVAASAELWAAVPQAAAPAPVAAPAAAPAPPVQAPAPVAPTPAPAPPAPAPRPPPAPTPPGPSAAEREAAIALEKALTRKKELDAQAARQARDAAERERQHLAQEAAQRQQQQLDQKRLADEKALTRQREQQAKADKAEKAEKGAEAKRQKAAAEQRELAEKEAEAKAQEALVTKQREENLKRMLGLAGATGPANGNANSAGNAARDGAPSAAYAGKIKAFIKPNIRLPVDVAGNPVTEVEVKLAPDGTVISRRVVKPSGNPSWDNTVLRAIDITATLPRDSDGRVPPTMLLVFPRQE